MPFSFSRVSRSGMSSTTMAARFSRVMRRPSSSQVPIYDEVEVSICNVCGAEITGNEAPHAKAHALAGEGGGHHNDYRSILVGYETVHHEAVGHWETIEDSGHWE